MPEQQRDIETHLRTSRVAQASFILAILMFVLPFTGGHGLVLAPFCAILAFVLGITGLVIVEKSGGRLSGRKRAIAGIVSPVLVFCLVGVLMPALERLHGQAFRKHCEGNLSGLGKAMLMYANDYQGQLPKAGAKVNTWVDRLPDWTASDRLRAFGISEDGGSTGKATLSSNLYLLIRHAECEPRMFVCKGESETAEFSLRRFSNLPATVTDLKSVWDFGPGSRPDGTGTFQFCSYSYHLPFGAFALSTGCRAGR